MHLEVKDFLRDRLYKFRSCMFVFVLLLVVFVFSNLVGGLMPLESLWCVAVALTLSRNNQIAALDSTVMHSPRLAHPTRAAEILPGFWNLSSVQTASFASLLAVLAVFVRP